MQPRDVPSRSPQAWGMQRKQTLDIGLFFHSLIIIIKFLIFFCHLRSVKIAGLLDDVTTSHKFNI